MSRHVLGLKMSLRLLLKRECGWGLVPKPAFTYHKNNTPDEINCVVASLCHLVVSNGCWWWWLWRWIRLGWWLCLKSKHYSFSGTHPLPLFVFLPQTYIPGSFSLSNSRVAQGLLKGNSRVVQRMPKGCSRVAQGLPKGLPKGMLKGCSRVA